VSSYNNFNILRLLLAVMVFFAHWNILTTQHISNVIFHLSEYAVDMFFIISGFLIYSSFYYDQNEKYFYIKRFFRVFPLYASLILVQTIFFISVSDGETWQIIKYFLSNILFLNFLAPSVAATLSSLEVDAINGSLWTLKNEVVFYIIVPLIFKLYKKWKLYFLITLYTLSIIYLFIVDFFDITKLLVQFPAQLRFFLVGVIFYIIFEKISQIQKLYINLMILFSVICIYLFIQNSYFKFTVYPFLIGSVVIYLVYYVKQINIKFDFSYSFYILHFPVIQLALYFGINPTNPTYSFLSLFLVVLVLSYFSERYIEKRFILIGKNLIRKYKNDTD